MGALKFRMELTSSGQVRNLPHRIIGTPSLEKVQYFFLGLFQSTRQKQLGSKATLSSTLT